MKRKKIKKTFATVLLSILVISLLGYGYYYYKIPLERQIALQAFAIACEEKNINRDEIERMEIHKCTKPDSTDINVYFTDEPLCYNYNYLSMGFSSGELRLYIFNEGNESIRFYPEIIPKHYDSYEKGNYTVVNYSPKDYITDKIKEWIDSFSSASVEQSFASTSDEPWTGSSG